MDLFEYRSGRLYCEDVPAEEIVAAAGTPTYVYSAGTLLDHYRKIAAAYASAKPIICYSVKTLGNLAVCRLLREAGAGFDVVSGGELHRARLAGGDMGKVVFAGVGKTDAEITEALDADILLFNVESEPELENLARIAAARGKTARAALRVNPDVDPKTHKYISTGKAESKFGVDLDRARRIFAEYGRRPGVELCGVHLHIGSQITDPAPFREALEKTLPLIEEMRAKGFDIRYLDMGGGMGIHYKGNEGLAAESVAKLILPLIEGKGFQLILEPGRSIAGNAGILLTRLLYVKKSGPKVFYIVDGAMNDLHRPMMYGSHHRIWPAADGSGRSDPHRTCEVPADKAVIADVVGPVCESGDFFAKDRALPAMQRGDLMAVFSAGAYGFVMSSQYNARPRAAEVLVEGSKFRVVRRRETYEDLVAAEL
jgi:diaminopimelate decarboxylase